MRFIRKNFYGILYIIAALVAIGNIVEIRSAIVAMNTETRCVEYGCNNNCEKGSIFCYLHNSDRKTCCIGDIDYADAIEAAMEESDW